MIDKFNLINKELGNKVEKNKNLYPYLTLRTNTKAEYFFEAKTKKNLIKAKEVSLEHNLPLFILGGGSNLAVVKEIIPGLVVKNSYQYKKILKEKKDSVETLISSGYPVSKLVSETIDSGWAGFEYFKGLPGTMGGALYTNAKWTKPMKYFSDNLLYAYLIHDRGQVIKVNRDYFRFTYDFSILQKTKEILLEAVFRLKKDNSALLQKRAIQVLDYRKKTQPFGVATSGCFFKNTRDASAGYLIEKAGLKGHQVDDFRISDIHANFIINVGREKSNTKNLLKLLKLIKRRVKEKFGTKLKEEVEII